MWNFYIVLLQIHSGNCLQKIGILDLRLIKLLQNEQGCNFLPHSVVSYWREKLTNHRDFVCLDVFTSCFLYFTSIFKF